MMKVASTRMTVMAGLLAGSSVSVSLVPPFHKASSWPFLPSGSRGYGQVSKWRECSRLQAMCGFESRWREEARARVTAEFCSSDFQRRLDEIRNGPVES